jgi:hypothetical protein
MVKRKSRKKSFSVPKLVLLWFHLILVEKFCLPNEVGVDINIFTLGKGSVRMTSWLR